MNFLESIKVALEAIWMNKLRSLLTMLGIIIGIASVITVIAIGQGGQSAIDQEFESFGAGRAYLGTNWRENPTKKDRLTHSDVESIKRAFEDKLIAIIPSVSKRGKIKSRKELINIEMQGADENYDKIEKNKLIEGRYITSGDVKSKRFVTVISKESALDIFGRTNVLGETIHVDIGYNNSTFTIVGLYEKKKSTLQNLGGESDYYTIYVPLTTLEKITGMGDNIWGISLNIKASENAKEVTEKMIKLIERRHSNSGENKYRAYTAEGELESINKVTAIVGLIVGSIAAISLVVGGIGVMNIMLVSVTERTREIGIRKAIGAKRRDILLQFLVESVIISGIGGVIGTIIGVGISFIIAMFIKIPPSVSLMTIIIAWTFAGGIGIVSGIYPANKASKLDPIEALRYE